ncbi:efflux RND transporter periplasmic adaptor subunit [Leisingera sp.]|uniref:efflux RND transporter periplasmic adaptor subunit n=1 Tax=Leisingera sp. TaxID=1879318 RepID=UPI002B26A804|nr:efflux RND transporter periplasmic adaptor subunit [Leisingera sp.]
MNLDWIRKGMQGITAASLLVLSATAAQAQDAPPPQAVTVVTLQAEDVTLSSELPGRVVALGVAEVRPQVSGIIVERLFLEGGTVKEGDPLYRIDDAIYDAQVQQARASVAQAKANLTAAEKEEQRIAELFQRGVAAQQAIDDSLAGRDAARAGLLVAKAQLQAAEINLKHTVVEAPLSGRVGRALTTQGALVTAQQADPMAVIRQIDRVYVDVTASTADVLRYTRARDAQDEGDRGLELDPTVTLTLADGMTFEHRGTLLAAEPQVDPQTGVAVLRLQFPNPDGLLLPGMYVKAHVPVGLAPDVVLAPQQGVGRDRRGQPTALVVNKDNVVEARVLTVLGTQDSRWIVSEGLAAGDRLIVAGLQKTGPGATVIPEEQNAAGKVAQD